ncbi:MAG: thiol-disulfide oxidoreductase DCC family protein [Rehaibacterium terrae]|uniref:thiol-disulfide oxidoreductase DCC family protein n=1 Tax=Rehaibacterium terrae TaxID=1341696 RepID=UPI00391BA16C
MATGTNDRLTVFYDGACPRCVRDRARYERLAGEAGEAVEWCDITGRDAALRALDIDPREALLALHVLDAQGRVHRELDAYILLMARTRRLRWLARLIGLPGLRHTLSVIYRHLVRRRLRRQGRL